MKKTMFRFIFFVAVISFLAGCEKDNIGEENDEEIITTMLLQFTPQSGGPTVTYSFNDPDGPGGTNPTTDTIKINANSSYQVKMFLLNRTASPVDTISNEVKEEGDAHRFYYLPAAGSNITVNTTDVDDNNIPLGLNSVWTTGNAAAGSINIVLRHYTGNPPNKAVNDDVNSPKSSTDIDVTFKSVVQ